MTITQLEKSIRYITDANGNKTDVMVPLEVWKSLIALVQSQSGLDPVDELESNRLILSDIQKSVREVKSGQYKPVSELWHGIEDSTEA